MTTTFAQCINIVPIDKISYAVDLDPEWCIGSVPHGGYVTSYCLAVTRTHFSSTLKHLGQPHTVSLHLEFLRRTSPGTAVITISARKLGSRLSTVHISLSRRLKNGETRVEVEGYIIQSDITAEEGLSISSAWSLTPPTTQADLAKLMETGEDNHWFRQRPPYSDFRKAPQHVTFYVPKGGQQITGLTEEWIRFQPGGVRGSGKWTNDALGFVTDIFPHLIESHLQSEARTKDRERSKLFDRVDSSPEELLEGGIKYWYPTVVLNIDFKKVLPEEGVEWLFVRLRAKKILNGRMDCEIVVFNADGDLIVVSNHITLIYSAERNVAPRAAAGLSILEKL